MSGGLSRLRKLLIDEDVPELVVGPGAQWFTTALNVLFDKTKVARQGAGQTD